MTMPSNDHPFRCNVCYRRFSSSGSLKRHYDLDHTPQLRQAASRERVSQVLTSLATNMILLIIIFSIWVPLQIAMTRWGLSDAQQLRIDRYAMPWYCPGRTPRQVESCLFWWWPIALPLYLFCRRQIKSGNVPLR
jgi:hypothetical protein